MKSDSPSTSSTDASSRCRSSLVVCRCRCRSRGSLFNSLSQQGPIHYLHPHCQCRSHCQSSDRWSMLLLRPATRYTLPSARPSPRSVALLFALLCPVTWLLQSRKCGSSRGPCQCQSSPYQHIQPCLIRATLGASLYACSARFQMPQCHSPLAMSHAHGYHTPPEHRHALLMGHSHHPISCISL